MTTTSPEIASLQNNAAYRNALLAGTSPSSRRAYTRDLRYFWAWAELSLAVTEHYPVSLDTVIRFVLDHGGAMDPKIEAILLQRKLRTKPGALRIVTVRRYLTSLSIAHTEHAHQSPTLLPQIKLLLRRLQRANASQRPNKKAALTADLLRRLVETCDDSLVGVQDRANLLVGFASGGRRRAELANLYVEDLRRVEGGYLIRLRNSKTDQGGKGQEVPILGEAAQALTVWLIKSGIRSGKLFRGISRNGQLNNSIAGRTVNRIVKRRCQLAKIDQEPFGAHSLRSGFITETGRRGATLVDAMALSGHKTTAIAQGYYREGELMRNPTAHLLD